MVAEKRKSSWPRKGRIQKMWIERKSEQFRKRGSQNKVYMSLIAYSQERMGGCIGSLGGVGVLMLMEIPS